MDLVQLQRALARYDQRYPDWLRWRQNGDVITAKPRFCLPDNAHRAILQIFQRYGGRYVYHNHESYYELVLGNSEGNPAHPIAKAFNQFLKEA